MKRQDFLRMSQRELHRMQVLAKLADKRMTQVEAARQLKLTTRQVRRLAQALATQGAPGVVSKRRGRPSNNQVDEKLRMTVLTTVRARYEDFGPTLANEKLREVHELVVSTETLRKWMTDAGFWVPRKRRLRIQQPRHRRSCLGELVQIDGSQHHWFEDRGPQCSLLVYIDDATSRLMQLRFVPTESAFDYMDTTTSYIEQHGKPVAFYSDKHTIFRAPTSLRKANGTGETQFGRALMELNIDIICANTPQAKGRVERANLTLQDRLVKELRLRKINTMADGNAFLPAFVEDYNRRFAKDPACTHDAHRPLLETEILDDIMAWKEPRTVSKQLVVHYKRRKYHLEETEETLGMAGKVCTIVEWSDGRVAIRHEHTDLPFFAFDKNPMVQQATIVENKRLGAALTWIQKQQASRDEQRLANPKLTLRQKASIRDQQAVALCMTDTATKPATSV